MLEKRINVYLPNEAEERPVAVLVQLANQYASKIHVQLDDKRVNAKSIMGMMSIPLSSGSEITLYVDGEDEADAMQNMETYLLSGEK